MVSKKREFLSACRKAKGSQSYVANQLEISTVYVRMIENGTFTPGRDLMFKMSDYFNEPIIKLFPDYFDNNRVIKHA
nr:helix-turn-helix transcriptional regulator [Brevibacillus sp. HB1.4B]